MTLAEIKAKWEWIKHPEGGYFYPKYLSEEKIAYQSERPNRSLYSSIYFLIEKDDPSLFHQLEIDELWHFYDGDSLTLHEINQEGDYNKTELGKSEFQYLVKRHTWMAAECNGPKGFSLFGCSLSPAYKDGEFKMGEYRKLVSTFPLLESIIRRLTP